MKPKKLSADARQSRFLSQAIQLEESYDSLLVRLTTLAVSATVIVFIAWSAVTNINEVARTPGEVVPQGFEQTVQHLEGGIVREIMVHDGDVVQKGQVLMRLDGAGTSEDLARALSEQKAILMQEERLRADSQNRKPDFSRIPGLTQQQLRDQEKFFRDMVSAHQEDRSVIAEQIQQKKEALQAYETDLRTAQSSEAIASDLFARRQTLNEKGYTSDIKFLEAKQNLNALRGEIEGIQNRISMTRAEIKEFSNRMQSLSSNHNNDVSERLDQLMEKKAENAELIDKLQGRVARLDVIAPVKGVVKGLELNTVGAVVSPGETLMDIVPMDESLVIQVKIPPQHIGHIEVGQKVEVKFSSFDFSRYGVVPGKLDRISATTFTGANGERYYQGRILLDRNYVGQSQSNRVLPGMTVMAEIITGRKTLLDYLLKPVHNAMKTAFSER